MDKILSFISIFRLENSFKNVLIFFPFLISEKNFFSSSLIDLCIGFIIFTTLTSICYATNDYSDQKRDEINKLKNKKKTLNKKIIIVLNIALCASLFLLYLYSPLFNLYLVLYLLLFYGYNFFFKNYFLLDIIILVLFYIIRIFYGSTVLEIEISYWFLIFFSSLFINLSIFKRMIQISVNVLKEKNLIINYSFKDFYLLKNIIFFSFLINISTFILYIYEIFNPGFFGIFSSTFTSYKYELIPLIIFFIIYFFWFLRLVYLVINGKVNEDIYIFLIKDKFSYIFVVIPFVIILLYNLY